MSLADDDVANMKAGGLSDAEAQAYVNKQAASYLDAGFSQQEVQEKYLGVKTPDASGVAKLAETTEPASGALTPDNPAVRAEYVGNLNRGDVKSPQSFLQAALQSVVPVIAGGVKRADQAATAYTSGVKSWVGSMVYPFASDNVKQDLINTGIVEPEGSTVAKPGAPTGPELLDAALKGERTTVGKAMGGIYAPVSALLSPLINPIMEKTPEVAEAAGVSPGYAKSVPGIIGAGMDLLGVAGLAKMGAAPGAPMEFPQGAGPWDKAPAAQDFVDAAQTTLGTKGAVEGSQYLRDVYQETGVHPADIAQAAKIDPSLAQNLASASGKEPIPAPPEEAAPAEPPAEGETPAEPPVKTAQEQVLEKISMDGNAPKEGMTWRKFYTGVVDKLDPIAQVAKAMKDGDAKAAVEQSYKLMRNVPGAGGMAEQFIKYGTFDFDTLETNGKSLSERLDPVADDMNGFRAYWVAKHSMEMEEAGLKSGIPQEAAAQVVKDGAGKYEPVVRDVIDFSHKGIDFMRDAGVFSDKAAEDIKNKWNTYAPTYRVLDNANDGFGVGFNTKNVVKAKTGSTADIIDPVESIVRNTYSYMKIAERNAAVNSFVDGVSKEADPEIWMEKVKPSVRPITVQDAEMTKFLSENGIEGAPDSTLKVFRAMSTPLAKDEVGYFDEGKWKVIKVDPDLAEAFNGVPRQAHGMLFNLARLPAALLRSGLANPEFIIRHFYRNLISTFVIGDKSELSDTTMPYVFKGLKEYLTGGDEYQNWLKSGGQVRALTAIDRDGIQDMLNKLTDRSKFATPLDLIKNEDSFVKPWNIVRSPFDMLHAVQTAVESGMRVGGMMQAMDGLDVNKENLIDSSYYARNIAPDPSRMGSRTASWNAITALFNTEIQHTDQFMGAMRDRPLPTLAKAVSAISIPAIALWAVQHNKVDQDGINEWKEAHQWERDFFQLVQMGGFTLRIPRPFLMGEVFGAIPERILDKVAGGDPNNRGLKHLATDLGAWAVPNVMPTGLLPPLEQITNYSFFRGSKLVPDHLMQELPEYQYNEYTSELTKALSKIVGYVPFADTPVGSTAFSSPQVIDNYIYKWTGGIGAYALQLADAGLRKAGMLPDPPTPAWELADIPIIKGFVVRYPSATADSIQKFQEDYQKRAQVYNTFQALIKQSDPNAAINLLNQNPTAMMKLDGINKTLSQENQLIRMLWKMPASDKPPSQITEEEASAWADQKRQIISATYRNMINQAKAGNEIIQQLDATTGK